jgi:hypothetical protein
MKSKFISAAIVLAATVYLSSCKKDEVLDPSKNASAKIEFDHFFKSEKFQLNKEFSTNNPTQQMTFSTFKYYVSNISLTRKDGEVIKLDNIYRLVDAGASSSVFIDLPKVPQGEYTAMSYMIGIDSATTSLGVQGGDLDPINGMVWNWNSGYIFLKAEGTSPQASGDMFMYHIGGFRESNNTNAARIINHSFGNSVLRVVEGAKPKIHLYVDISKMFEGADAVNIANKSTHMAPGAIAQSIADVYVRMFSFDHLHN